MKILRIRTNSIVFGCIEAEDLRRNAATVLLYEDLSHTHTRDTVPSKGDYFLCRLYHSSTYVIVKKVTPEHMALHSLPLAHDIVHWYFPCIARTSNVNS